MSRIPVLIVLIMIGTLKALSYPPAVGILSNSPNCITCHVNNGPWTDDNYLILDVLDRETKKSLRQTDGSFLIEIPRNVTRTVLTILGRKAAENQDPPYRNAWLYVDPQTIGNASLSKFPPGWEVNLPIACRLVGDAVDNYPGANVTVLPMSVRPTDSAQDGTLILQVMMTRGDSVKGKAKEGMVANYFERRVQLVVK